RTLDVGANASVRLPRKDVIPFDSVKPGHVIIGLSSFGQCAYEAEFNSGIGCNGLTSARQDLLDPYFLKYTESFAPETSESLVYCAPELTPEERIRRIKMLLS